MFVSPRPDIDSVFVVLCWANLTGFCGKTPESRQDFLEKAEVSK
jgi:hypothetical protein